MKNDADNVIPGSAKATFNIRFNNRHSSNSIKRRLNKIFKKITNLFAVYNLPFCGRTCPQVFLFRKNTFGKK